jgi:hypothetical protein
MPVLTIEIIGPLKIVIETVDHQRYPTAGDWQLKPDGLHILVSRMSDQRYEFLVGMHEAIEAYLCKQAGISQVAVDRFDQAYERRRKPGDDSAVRETILRRPTTRSTCSPPRSNACLTTSSTSTGALTIARFPASKRPALHLSRAAAHLSVTSEALPDDLDIGTCSIGEAAGAGVGVGAGNWPGQRPS